MRGLISLLAGTMPAMLIMILVKDQAPYSHVILAAVTTITIVGLILTFVYRQRLETPRKVRTEALLMVGVILVGLAVAWFEKNSSGVVIFASPLGGILALHFDQYLRSREGGPNNSS